MGEKVGEMGQGKRKGGRRGGGRGEKGRREEGSREREGGGEDRQVTYIDEENQSEKEISPPSLPLLHLPPPSLPLPSPPLPPSLPHTGSPAGQDLVPLCPVLSYGASPSAAHQPSSLQQEDHWSVPGQPHTRQAAPPSEMERQNSSLHFLSTCQQSRHPCQTVIGGGGGVRGGVREEWREQGEGGSR